MDCDAVFKYISVFQRVTLSPFWGANLEKLCASKMLVSMYYTLRLHTITAQNITTVNAVRTLKHNGEYRFSQMQNVTRHVSTIT
jgi:hypothetical protein